MLATIVRISPSLVDQVWTRQLHVTASLEGPGKLGSVIGHPAANPYSVMIAARIT